MTRRSQGSGPRIEGPVRITLPAAVANNLSALKETITGVAERLGCRTCFSGADCVFRIERELVVDGPKQLRPAATLFSPDPDGDPAIRFGRTVNVNMPVEVSQDLEKILGLVDTVAERIKAWPGHLACCSGFDIAFRRELNFVTVDQNFNVNTSGPAFGG